MSQDLYRPPRSDVEDASEEPFVVPEEIDKKIRAAVGAGLFSGGVTLLVTLLAIGGMDLLQFDAWGLIDVALIFGLTYGIHRRSRACAVAMTLYFIASKLIMAFTTGASAGIGLGVVFAYFFVRGAVGTFEYHALLREHRATGRWAG